MVLIKKYGNRRLYDTEASRYITLDELSARIRGGSEVRVVDAKSQEDLTGATLTQLIMENRGASRLLPVSLLHQLIRLGDDSLAEFFSRYVGGALEMYLRSRQFNPFAALTPFFNPAPPPSSDVDELRRELEEMKKQMPKRRR